MPLRWNGKAVLAAGHAAAIKGVNKTMAECIATAKDLVHVDTSALQGSIRMEPAQVEGGRVVGRWGSFDINYALWQEVLPPARGGKAYLRPAADQHYKSLTKNIAEAAK